MSEQCTEDQGTKVIMELSPDQAQCLRKYGCFMQILPKEENIPVGTSVVAVISGNGVTNQVSAIIVAVQSLSAGDDVYAIANAQQVARKEVVTIDVVSDSPTQPEGDQR